MNEAQLASVFAVFLASEDFMRGVLLATRASFGGGSYSVELYDTYGLFSPFWSIMDTAEIGNAYESRGVLLTLPTLSEDEYAVLEIVSSDNDMASLMHSLYGSDELELCKQALQEKYADAYRQRTAYAGGRDTHESEIR